MGNEVLRYAERCVEYEHRKGRWPAGVSQVEWRWIIKDCHKYIELSNRTYRLPEELTQKNIDRYKMECIETRLKKYITASRNWGKKQ